MPEYCEDTSRRCRSCQRLRERRVGNGVVSVIDQGYRQGILSVGVLDRDDVADHLVRRIEREHIAGTFGGRSSLLVNVSVATAEGMRVRAHVCPPRRGRVRGHRRRLVHDVGVHDVVLDGARRLVDRYGSRGDSLKATSPPSHKVGHWGSRDFKFGPRHLSGAVSGGRRVGDRNGSVPNRDRRLTTVRHTRGRVGGVEVGGAILVELSALPLCSAVGGRGGIVDDLHRMGAVSGDRPSVRSVGAATQLRVEGLLFEAGTLPRGGENRIVTQPRDNKIDVDLDLSYARRIKVCRGSSIAQVRVARQVGVRTRINRSSVSPYPCSHYGITPASRASRSFEKPGFSSRRQQNIGENNSHSLYGMSIDSQTGATFFEYSGDSLTPSQDPYFR